MDDTLNLPTRGTAPFFVANRAVHPTGNLQIPAHMLERLPHGHGAQAPLVITTIEAIDEIGLPIARHRRQFLAGEVVMVAPRVVEHLAERPHGGQTVPTSGLEQQARDGLRIVVVLTTEIIRACRDREENTKGDLEERRINITAEMEPLLAGFFGMNSFRAGQELLPDRFPGRTASSVMKDAYREIANMPRMTSPTHFARISTEQMGLVRTAGLVYAKVRDYQAAQHAMSAQFSERCQFLKRQENATFLRVGKGLVIDVSRDGVDDGADPGGRECRIFSGPLQQHDRRLRGIAVFEPPDE